VKDNLHIILAMSPAGDSLRIRCRNFPGMVSNTSIDWFFNWPEEALESVANYFLGEVDLPLDVKPKIISHIVMTHISISKFSEDFER
jgi:dynein heavy chain